MHRIIALIIGPATVSACTIVAPSPPEVDVGAFNAETVRVNDLPATAAQDLPTGQVTYDGQFGSNVFLNGEDGHALIGDMEMSIAFDDNTIDGTLNNVVLLSEGADNQVVTGSLDINGLETGGAIAATASGTLDFDDGFGSETSNMDLFLNGDVLNDIFAGDAVGGELTGAGSGSVDVLLDGNGSFYGLAD